MVVTAFVHSVCKIVIHTTTFLIASAGRARAVLDAVLLPRLGYAGTVAPGRGAVSRGAPSAVGGVPCPDALPGRARVLVLPAARVGGAL